MIKFEKNIHGFLQFRKTAIDISELEDRFGLQLPPIYKSFITNFLPFFKYHKIRLNNGAGGFHAILAPCYNRTNESPLSIDDDELSFESFKEVDEMLDFNASHTRKPEGMLFIANHGYSGGLLLGIDESNRDCIYHKAEGGDIVFEANNVFDIVRRLTYVEDQLGPVEVNSKQLYKNWGEDFWRVREDDQA